MRKNALREKKCDKLVVKHNKLIEFKGRMTTNELKLFSLIVADIREQQERVLEEYKINISVLKETTEHKDFYNYIKEVAFKLEEKSIEVENINKQGKKESFKMRLIYRPLIIEDSNYLEVLLDKELIPYVIDLKEQFTRYQIENILRLRSNYSIRIYELLKQYEKIGEREIEVKCLRTYLGILEDEYSRFYDFERWVLKVSKEEINEHTDLDIDYKKIKTGRRITSILFKIEAKDQDRKVYIDFLNEYYNIKEMKSKMGLGEENFSTEQIMSVYEKAIEMAGNEDINLFEYIRLNYIHIKDKARNKYAYLLKALENDYASAIGQISLDYYIER
ncbi:MAG: replication initiation protein [Senegalia sp. (in: firmicutes)]